MNKALIQKSILVSTVILILSYSNCQNSNTLGGVTSSISGSSLNYSGSGTNQVNSVNYVFADSTGLIYSTNTFSVTIPDGNLPLSAYWTGPFSDSVVSGSCTSLPEPAPTISGNTITTQIVGSGCTDQTELNVQLNAALIIDNKGQTGNGTTTFPVVIDLAPIVTSAASGNSADDGSGNTEANVGTFSIASDQSIVVTFSKSLTSGSWNAVLSSCGATLGRPTLVASSSGTIVTWPLTNLSQVSAGSTCTLNVSAVADAVANVDDPNDPNQSMTITFF